MLDGWHNLECIVPMFRGLQETTLGMQVVKAGERAGERAARESWDVWCPC